jgi:hypothetical protein
VEIWQNIIIQLGISALIVFCFYKIAMVLIEKWAMSDKARTETIGEGFKAITGAHEKVIDTMNAHQQNELGILNEHAKSLAALNSKIDTALDLTPVRGMTRAQLETSGPSSKVIVASDMREDAPSSSGDKPRIPARAASSPGVYGPKKP